MITSLFVPVCVAICAGLGWLRFQHPIYYRTNAGYVFGAGSIVVIGMCIWDIAVAYARSTLEPLIPAASRSAASVAAVGAQIPLGIIISVAGVPVWVTVLSLMRGPSE